MLILKLTALDPVATTQTVLEPIALNLMKTAQALIVLIPIIARVLIVTVKDRTVTKPEV
jgi:septin family protein